MNRKSLPAMAGFFTSGARVTMKLDRMQLVGVICAVAAIGLVAWMCYQSWGGISPF
ncbi:hypothetical protein K1X12_07340 [Hyphomonas sp. WL0036]|uniref:hypothetical protein n=1 Tax=Hyphomonas sediminis TaxID=2866160 RepID=UPI001C7FCC1F|nr:hypothetical protein [Hyphomonas sediminis]MBY9066708.1 hypothetical protein [Hyphomonas sediminis]